MTLVDMTFRQHLARTLGHNLLATLVLATVGMGSLAMAPKESVDRPRIEQQHTCIDALYTGICGAS